MPEEVYELSDVWKIYGSGSSAVAALRGVSLKVHAGEFVAVMGPSGSGKTTLLMVLGLMTSPTRGTVRLLGSDVTKIRDAEATRLRRETIGFVFQTFNLVPWLTAVENVELALAIGGHRGDRRRRALELLDLVGLRERAHHRPGELSGGEQQRVAIARALANDPKIVLADEPTGNLDSRSGEQVVRMLADLARQGRTVVMVTHDREMASRADRVILLKDGRVLREVSPDAIP